MLTPGMTLGPYKIIVPLGAGGMGEVWKAQDTRLGRVVAIKVLPAHLSTNPEVRARFEREARAISQLSHPNICSLHDIGQQDSIDYIVMEYLEGETLAARLAKGSLPTSEVLRYGIEIANALDCAHRSGIVHRDLKPGNIMLTKSGAKLMDFGLARAVALSPAAGTLSESPTASSPLTAKGTIVGTFQYMAPEQLEAKETDARTDLWALGCVLYEMATGKRAFEGTSQASLIAAILKEPPRSMSELQPLTPPALERVTKRCLEKDPDERFQSAKDLAFDLESMTGTGTTLTAVASGATKPGWHLSTKAIAGVVLAAAILAAGFFSGRLTKQQPQSPAFTRLTYQRGMIRTARFTPDGKSVVYSAEWDGRPGEIFETRTDLSTTLPLGLPGIHLHSISRHDELAVKRAPRRTALSYAPLAVVPRYGSAPRDLLDGVSQADWSPDGVSLAVVKSSGGEDLLEMPPGHVLVKTSGWFVDVRVSPDGHSIALTEHPVLGDMRGTVAVVDAAGRKTTLTREFSNVSGVAWSPDGNEIWFSAIIQGTRQSLLAVTLKGRLRTIAQFPTSVTLQDVAPDGRVLLVSERSQTGIRGVSPADDKEKELGWLDFPWPRALSADGRMLLFDNQGETAGPTYEVYLRNTDGSPPMRLGKGAGCALSPDGRSALAIQYGPPHRLVLIPTGSGETRSLPRGQVDTYQTADFLPDGRRIVFVGAERGHPQRIWLQELPSGLPRPVTPEGTGTSSIATSPDGQWVAAIAQDSKIMLFPLQGGEPRPVAKRNPEEDIIQWSADGRTLYVSHAGNPLDVFSIDVQSTKRRLWKTFELPDPAGATIATFIVTRDAHIYAYSYFRILDDLYLAEGLK
jgi:Tol biopolymer transport system component